MRRAAHSTNMAAFFFPMWSVSAKLTWRRCSLSNFLGARSSSPRRAARREQSGLVAERFSRFPRAASAVSVRRQAGGADSPGRRSYDNVFIDESHRFRTETTQTYERLAQICRGKRVILVSATPLNNRPQDILSQVKLFQNGKNSTIPNVRNLEAFFARLVKQAQGPRSPARPRESYFATVQENAREIREKDAQVSDDPAHATEIAKYYATDLARPGPTLPRSCCTRSHSFTSSTRHENDVFTRTIRASGARLHLCSLPAPHLLHGRGSREVRSPPEATWRKFMKILLVKRLESSFHAFRLTLARFIRTYEQFLAAFDREPFTSARNTSVRSSTYWSKTT